MHVADFPQASKVVFMALRGATLFEVWLECQAENPSATPEQVMAAWKDWRNRQTW